MKKKAKRVVNLGNTVRISRCQNMSGTECLKIDMWGNSEDLLYTRKSAIKFADDLMIHAKAVRAMAEQCGRRRK